jgi:putative spermidine/putrescine transport system ATP-binding protein
VVTPDSNGDTVVMVATFRGATTRLRLLRADGVELLADVASHLAPEVAQGRRVSVSLLERPVLVAASSEQEVPIDE